MGNWCIQPGFAPQIRWSKMRVDFDNLMATNLSQLFLVLHEVRLKMPDVLVVVLLLGKKEPDLVFRYHLFKVEQV